MQTGNIVRANIDTNGAEMQKVTTVFNGNIYDGTQMQLSPSGFSTDGRYLTFVTNANNLSEGDINNRNDIFVKDLQTGLIKNLTVNLPVDGNLLLGGQAISGDGQFVTYRAGTLNSHDLYVQNIVTGTIVVANTDSAGVNLSASVNGQIAGVDISADGNFVAFVQGSNVYVKNLTTGELKIASADINGVAGVFFAGYTTGSESPSISADGRYVAFITNAGNLIADDTNFLPDVYIKDMQTGNIARVNVSASNKQVTLADYLSVFNYVVISSDGTKITFGSGANNLVLNDNNFASDVFVSPNPLLNVNTVIDAASTVINNVTIEDTDAGLNPVTITLQVENGDLKLLNTDGLLFIDSDGSDGSLSFSGLLGDINKVLTAGVQYTANIDFTGLDALLLNVNDQSFTNLTDTATFAITVLDKINDTAITGAAITGTAIDDNLVGTGLIDIIRGLAGDDLINAGMGADFIDGGAGNDTLIGGDGNDALIGGDGNDTLIGGLGGNTVYGGNGDDTIIVDSTVPYIYDGSDAQYLNGGAGNDTYYIKSVNTFSGYNSDYYHHLIEEAGGGIDTIVTEGSVTMGYHFENFENITLQGSQDSNVSGNNLDNTIIGNSANNILDGGLGNNTLTGGAGNDTFQLINQGIDTITDFVSGIDKLDVSNIYYLPFDYIANVLATSGFVSGAGVTSGDGSAQVIYNTTTGDLYYEDGLNSDAAVQIATLIGVPALVSSDFTAPFAA